MAAEGKIHVGDINTDIQLTVQDTQIGGANTPVNFVTTPIASSNIIVYDPSGNIQATLAASILNPPGTDGIIHAVNTLGTLFDEAGPWEFKGELNMSDGGKFTTNRILKEVLG